MPKELTQHVSVGKINNYKNCSTELNPSFYVTVSVSQVQQLKFTVLTQKTTNGTLNHTFYLHLYYRTGKFNSITYKSWTIKCGG